MREPGNVIIQSLWIGPRLSTMERLCIRSFLENGHEFHLFVYDEVSGIPAGTTLRNADEIVDRSRVFSYAGNGSFAGFANMFRYKLLLDRGGWWVDLDTVCLRPFDFHDEYVIASEFGDGGEIATTAVLKAEPGSRFMEYVWRECLAKDPSKLVWGETGPRLVATAVRALGLERFTKPAKTFCPIAFREWRSTIHPEAGRAFDADIWAVHLWHEMWRRAGADKDANYSPHCLFERLKSRYPGS